MNGSILEAALEYAGKGWPVIPCKRDKSPYIKGGFKQASIDEDQIKAWWQKWPDAMIGVPTGKRSGVWALDIDVPKKRGDADGRETLNDLIKKHGPIPATFTQETPSGGRHYFFKTPQNQEIKCNVKSKAAGIDVRGEGGYVIVGPSINNLGVYKIVDASEPADAPAWLLELITDPKKTTPNEKLSTPAHSNNSLHPYIAKALRENMHKIAHAEQGSRNDTLFKNVALLAGYIPTGNLDETLLYKEAITAYQLCNPEDFDKEFEKTFRSAVEDGKKTPKEIPTLLPPNFKLIKNGEKAGLWYEEPSKRNPEEIIPFKVGAPLTVLGWYRDDNSANWGKLVEWEDPDKIVHRFAIPSEMLAGSDSSLWRSILAADGYCMTGGRKTNELLTNYLCGCQPVKRFIGVNRTGWHKGCFVLPDETLPLNNASNIILVKPPLRNPYQISGNLDDWRNNIGRFAAGNSRLIFALCAAFAAPLLHIVGQESGGFNFFGPSSIGKSTALFVASSVWGKGSTSNGYILSWRSTDNGLEAQAELHSDTLLCLDELSQANTKVIAETIYMLGNSQGKARAKRNGDNRQIKDWRVMFLSSGEQTLENKLLEDGKTARGGQSVRMLDIAAEAEMNLGIFETLHGINTAQELADTLKHSCSKFYGAPSRAFIERLISINEKDANLIKSIYENIYKDVCPTNADGQVKRACQKFALCITAGLIAAVDKDTPAILPVPTDEVIQACTKCFKNWLSQRGGQGAWEERQIIERANNFLSTQKSRFESLDASGHLPFYTVPNRAGFIKTENKKSIFYVLGEVFRKEIANGMQDTDAAKVLYKHGILIKTTKNRWQTKLPQEKQDVGRPWVFALCIHTDE